MADPLLTASTLILAKKETTFNEFSEPTPQSDALLISEPGSSEDVAVIERNLLSSSISPSASRAGRITSEITFTHEIRGNGKEPNAIANAPDFAKLLEPCTFNLSTNNAYIFSKAIQTDPPNVQTDNFAEDSNSDSSLDYFTEYDAVMLDNYNSDDATPSMLVGFFSESDKDSFNSDTFSVEVQSIAGDATQFVDYAANTMAITFTGAFVEFDIITVTLGGYTLNYTLLADQTADGTAGEFSNLLTGLIAVTTSDTQEVQDDPLSNNKLPLNFTNAAVGAVSTINWNGANVSASFKSNNFSVATTSAKLGSSGITLSWDNSNATLIILAAAMPKGATLPQTATKGDAWRILATPSGLVAKPVTGDYDSFSFVYNLDGLEKKVTGARGTFSISATAGELPSASFTFNGQFLDPEDVDRGRTASQEETVPGVVEFMDFRFNHDADSVVVKGFEFDLATTVVPINDINKKDGYDGFNVTSRAPTLTVTAQATLVADKDFWSDLRNATPNSVELRFNAGSAFNVVHMYMPVYVISGISGGDEDGIATYELSGTVARKDGDDEVWFLFR